MKIDIPDQLIIDGVSAAAEKMLLSDKFIDRIVDAIILRFECLTPMEAAKFLDVTTRTLSDNHVAWGLDKSLALGPSNPRYLLSQIIARLEAKAIKGKKVAPLKLEGDTAA